MAVEDYLRNGWLLIDIPDPDFILFRKLKIREIEEKKITYKTEEFYKLWKILELPEEDYDSVVKIIFTFDKNDLLVKYFKLNQDDPEAFKQILNF